MRYRDFIKKGFSIRSVKATTMTVLLACAVSGCVPYNPDYYARGVGAQLATPSARTSLELQQEYFNYLCLAAMMSEDSFSGSRSRCVLSDPFSPEIWTLITLQGLNDIDRRCDAYLEWLDDRRRSKAPLLSQVSTTQATTLGIMGVTQAGSAALTIVGLAFELLTKSIENYHSRLLMEVDGTTVTAIVLQSRRQFRSELGAQLNSGERITTKPQAEFVLRQYLRLCMPFVIETKINQFSTLGAFGVAATAGNSVREDPQVQLGRTRFVAGERAAADTFVDRQPPRPTPPFEVGGARNDVERNLTRAEASKIQRVLCVEPDGVFGPETRARLELWEPNATRNAEIDEAELSDFAQSSDCPDDAANPFEALLLGSTGGRDQIRQIAVALRDAGFDVPADASLGQLRQHIRSFKANNEAAFAEEADVLIDEITPLLVDELDTSTLD